MQIFIALYLFKYLVPPSLDDAEDDELPHLPVKKVNEKSGCEI
jgi:hypothetical protein